jgi:hypothetical protein
MASRTPSGPNRPTDSRRESPARVAVPPVNNVVRDHDAVVEAHEAVDQDSQRDVRSRNQTTPSQEHTAPWGFGGLGPPKQGTSDAVRAFRGHTSPELVGVVEALAHPDLPARRLLDMAGAWPTSLPNGPCPSNRIYRTMRQLRPAEVDALVTAYEAGATVYDLAAQFGINRKTVGQHLRARGVDTKQPGLHPDDVPTAATLYRDGWSLTRLADKFGTSANTVRARLLEVGVTMRDPHGREQ